MKTYWQHKTPFGKILLLTLLVLNILFFIYWTCLSMNYCLHYDDVHFMWKLRDYSIFDYIKEMYLTRGGNFVGYSLNAILFVISNWLSAYRFWSILFYIVGITMVYYVVRDFKFNITKGELLLGVISFYNIYILTSVDFAVFTWICALAYYLYAPAICLLLKFINSSSLKIRQTIFMWFLALFIAGSSVSISTATFVILFINGLYFWYNKGWDTKQTWNTPQTRRLIYITIFMLLVFVVVVIAPGNYSRMANEIDIEQPKTIIEFFSSCCICFGMFGYMMLFYLLYHIIVFMFGYIVGTRSLLSFSLSRKKIIVTMIGLFAIYLFLSVMPLAYLNNGFQIQRNYTQLTFFYIACIFIIGCLFGLGKHQNIIKSQITTIGFSIFMIIIVLLNLRQDVPVARSYRLAHDQREAYLLNLQEEGNTETIYVAPYPTTQTPDIKYNVLKFLGKKTNMQAIYYESDTDYMPNEYESHMRHLLYLDFDFVLKPCNNENIVN